MENNSLQSHSYYLVKVHYRGPKFHDLVRVQYRAPKFNDLLEKKVVGGVIGTAGPCHFFAGASFDTDRVTRTG